MEDMIYEDARNERSSGKKLNPTPVKCAKTDFSHNENTAVNCPKLIGDFRFLLQSEFYDLATISFWTKSPDTNHLKSPDNSSHNTNIEGTSQDLNDSFPNPHTWNMAVTQLRPGTTMKMLFSQIEQNMETFTLQERSQMFHRNYSKLVIYIFFIFACKNG